MAVLERTVWVDAPLAEVWAFHSRIAGLEALTPDWLHLQVESVTGPDGEADPPALDVGSEIRLSIRPAGIGPRMSWTSRITDRDRSEGSAYFVDEMLDGPFRLWQHTHRFYAEDGGTRLIDRVDYALPYARWHRLSAMAKPFIDGMFTARHRATKRELE